MTTIDTATPTRVSTKNKVGLVLAGLLGLANLISPLTPGGDSGDPDSAGPPMGVLIVGAVIAVVTLVAVVHNWVTGKRYSARIVAGTLILEVLSSLPAFFVSGVPAPVIVLVAVSIVLTVVSIVLTMSRPVPAAG